MKTKFTVRKPSLTVRESILNLLRKSSKPLDAKTIAKKGKLNYNTVRKELGYLRRNDVDFGINLLKSLGMHSKIHHYHTINIS